MAGAGEDEITYPRAVSLLGATEGALIDDTVDALAAGDGATLSVGGRTYGRGLGTHAPSALAFDPGHTLMRWLLGR